eukprot:jgi/Galph1/5835/GphlegSOOS_G4538.1
MWQKSVSLAKETLCLLWLSISKEEEV